MRPGVIVLGLLLILGMFFYADLYLTPQQKAQIRLADSLCGSPFGLLAQGSSSQTAQVCNEVAVRRTILALQPAVYLVGFILVIVGVVASGRTQTVSPMYQQPLPQQIQQTTGAGTMAICPSCKTRIALDTKFCSECGADLRPKTSP